VPGLTITKYKAYAAMFLPPELLAVFVEGLRKAGLPGGVRPLSLAAASGMPSIEEINQGGRGAIGTPDDALRVLENYWTKTGGFGCILMLAHDWADWEATKRSYELFARYVLPRFEERSAWRSQSMDWTRANREAFSAKRKAAAANAVERHFAGEQARRKREAAK
jgi:limonene 1,2-monooxygenase